MTDVIHGIASPPSGWALTHGASVTVEPAPGRAVVVRIYAGAPVEAIQLDGHNEPIGDGWTLYDVDEEFPIDTGERFQLRARGSGGATVGFEWRTDG